MSTTRFILAGSCIDGSGAPARRQVFLQLEDGQITAIGAAGDLPRHTGAPIDDLSHCTIVPAMVDCSVSLSRSPAVDSAVRAALSQAGPEARAAMVARHLRYCHAYGVLGVADSDDDAGLTRRYRTATPAGSIIDLRTSGRLCRSVEDVDPGQPMERDFLKICSSANVDDEESGAPGLSREGLHGILRHHRGLRTVVVANGRQAVAEALAAGCDAIEQGYLMGEDNLRTMAERRVLWIPSVLRAKNGLDGSGSGGDVCCRFSQRYVAPGTALPGAEALWKKLLADQLGQLRRARSLGVVVAVGTGAGSMGILHGESVVEEMKLFIKAGYPLAETIHCASEPGARFFGMEGLGALAVGRPATFLVTRGTPQQLPRKLSFLEGIYINGAPSETYRKDPVRAAG